MCLKRPEFRDIYPIVPNDSDTITAYLQKECQLAVLILAYPQKRIVFLCLVKRSSYSLEGTSASQYFMPEGELSIYILGDYKLMLSTDKQDILKQYTLNMKEIVLLDNSQQSTTERAFNR